MCCLLWLYVLHVLRRLFRSRTGEDQFSKLWVDAAFFYIGKSQYMGMPLGTCIEAMGKINIHRFVVVKKFRGDI